MVTSPAEHLTACAEAARTAGVLRARVRVGDVEVEVELGPPRAKDEPDSPLLEDPEQPPDPLEAVDREWRKRRGSTR